MYGVYHVYRDSTPLGNESRGELERERVLDTDRQSQNDVRKGCFQQSTGPVRPGDMEN